MTLSRITTDIILDSFKNYNKYYITIWRSRVSLIVLGKYTGSWSVLYWFMASVILVNDQCHTGSLSVLYWFIVSVVLVHGQWYSSWLCNHLVVLFILLTPNGVIIHTFCHQSVVLFMPLSLDGDIIYIIVTRGWYYTCRCHQIVILFIPLPPDGDIIQAIVTIRW